VVESEITVINRLGLHARAAAKFVSLASGFQAEVTVTREGREVNGKSIMGVMMLAAGQGSVLCLRAEGPDESAAIAGLSELINDRFGEDQ